MPTLTASGAPVQIETASWRDLSMVRNLEKVCFSQDAWPLWDIIGVLTFPNVVRLKAVRDGELIGFIAGDIRTHENASWIATLGVLPEHRSQGIGWALLEACEAQLSTPLVRLCVRPTNAAAIHLYEQHGYRRAETWRSYYRDGEDALVMEKWRGSGL